MTVVIVTVVIVTIVKVTVVIVTVVIVTVVIVTVVIVTVVIVTVLIVNIFSKNNFNILTTEENFEGQCFAILAMFLDVVMFYNPLGSVSTMLQQISIVRNYISV